MLGLGSLPQTARLLVVSSFEPRIKAAPPEGKTARVTMPKIAPKNDFAFAREFVPPTLLKVPQSRNVGLLGLCYGRNKQPVGGGIQAILPYPPLQPIISRRAPVGAT